MTATKAIKAIKEVNLPKPIDDLKIYDELSAEDAAKDLKNLRNPFILDIWQKEVLKAQGNLCICSGRQVGKSFIISIKAAEYLVSNKNKSILIISVTEDQAELMIQKILLYLSDRYPKAIRKGKDKPTKHMIKMTNGSQVRCKAVGTSGVGVLGLTIDLLICDEAAYMPEAIWPAVTPMLLTTGGNIILISTPNAQQGFFYEAYTDPDMNFQTFHISSEEVAEARPEPYKTLMLQHLEHEKARMSELQYSQQYKAQFLEELRQLFPDSLIQARQLSERQPPMSKGDYYLGVDVARMGGDECVFSILKRLDTRRLIQVENIIKTKILTTETTGLILELDSQFHFKKIYIDDGGLGVAVFDSLLVNEQTKRRVVAINNASRPLDRDEKRKKKLLKEDLYMNLLRLMETGQIDLLKDDSIFASLKSIVLEEVKDKSEVRIHGRYSHIAESLIRSAWCVKDKSLNIWIR